MQLRVLGRPALVGADGRVEELRGKRQIGLLGLLAAHRGHRVSAELVEDELWDTEVSEAALRVTVKRLRERFEAVVGSDPIERRAGGYVLAIDDGDVDQGRFEALLAACRRERQAGRPGAAVATAKAASGLWSGVAFDGAHDLPSVRPEHHRLELLRLDLAEEHAAALLEDGDDAGALDVLDRLGGGDPFREAPWALRMLALYRLQRQHEALATSRAVHERFLDELGIAPGALLRDVELAILDQRPPAEIEAMLLSPGRTPPPAELPGSPPIPTAGPFVGHAELVAELRDLATGTTDARVAVVEGVVGIGKTRLARQVVAGLTIRCLWGDGGRAGVLADPVDQLLRDLGSAATVDGATGAVQALVDGGPPAAEERHLAAVVARATEAIGALEDGVVVVVDDVHRLDERAATVLASLVERTPSARWLIFTRPDGRTPAADRFLAVLSRQAPAWRTLGPLDVDDVRQLAEAVLGPRPELADWTAVVARQAGGNPFLTTELLRHLQRTGDPGALPASVRAAIAAEVTDLGPDATSFAECLALTGRALPAEVVGRAAGVAASDTGRVLRRLAGAGFATTVDGGVALTHEIVRETLVDGQREPDRRARHEALAHALAGIGPDVDDERLHHLLAAGSRDPQVLDEVAAGAFRQLRTHLANAEVVRLGDGYLTAVSDQETTRAGLEARIHLAAALLETGQHDRGHHLLEAARDRVAQVDAPTLVADAIFAREITTQSYGSVSDEEIALARRALADLPSDEWRRRVLLAGWLAFVLAGRGHTDEAQALLRRAQLDVADRMAPDLEAILLALQFRANAGVDGDPAQLRSFAGRLHEVGPAAGISGRYALVLCRLDHDLRFIGVPAHAAAVEDLAAMIALADRSAYHWLVAAARAGNRLASGALDGVDAMIADAEELGRTSAGTGPTMVGHIQRLLLDRELGRLERWRKLVPDDPVAGVGSVLAAQGLVFAETGDRAALAPVADALVECGDARAMNAEGWAFGASLMADIAVAAGNRRLAESLHAAVLPHAGTGLPVVGLAYVGSARRVLGRCAEALDDLDAAVDALEQAMVEDRDRGAPRWAAHAAEAAAGVRRRRGGRDDGREADALLAVAADLRACP